MTARVTLLENDPLCNAGRGSVLFVRKQTNLPLGAAGAMARNKFGTLAAAASTGAVVNQRRGRVGDSAAVGAGGPGGLIIVDRDGACARANSTSGMRTAMVENGEPRVRTT